MRFSRTFLRSLAAAALLVLTAQRSVSQSVPETPEQVAARYLHAMGAQQWDSMAFLMHPSALHQMREWLAPLFTAPNLDGAREEILGVRSLTAVQALSDTGVFVVYIAHGLSSQTQLLDLMRRANIQVIGHVPEGPDTVHIVYRMSLEDSTAAIAKLGVFSMQRMGNTWRGLLTVDLRMLGALLRRQART